MKSTRSNKELLLRIRNGDMVAFYNLYNRYSKRLYGFIIRYIKQEADAEEIVQDVFMKIWEERHGIDTDLSFDSFLFTIAYNKTISMLRKKANEQKYLTYLQSIQNQNNFVDVLDEIYFKELNTKVLTIVNELTPQQKIIYQLSREQGLAQKEIAEELNISVNTVKKHITNILALFKAKLKANDFKIILVLLVFF